MWILTSSFQKFMTGSMNPNETNFRIQAGYVDELIRGTKCRDMPLAPHNNHGYQMLLFSKWRSWHREKYDNVRLHTSARWHKYPNFFAEYYYPPTTPVTFPKFFTKPFASWSTRSAHDLESIHYSVFVDHDWKTRECYMYLDSWLIADSWGIGFSYSLQFSEFRWFAKPPSKRIARGAVKFLSWPTAYDCLSWCDCYNLLRSPSILDIKWFTVPVMNSDFYFIFIYNMVDDKHWTTRVFDLAFHLVYFIHVV